MISGADLIITLVNLALCIAIVILGYLGFQKRKDVLAVSIGLAYVLFAFSHFVTLLGEKTDFAGLLIIARIVAYLIIIVALGKRVI